MRTILEYIEELKEMFTTQQKIKVGYFKKNMLKQHKVLDIKTLLSLNRLNVF